MRYVVQGFMNGIILLYLQYYIINKITRKINNFNLEQQRLPN